MLLLLLLLLLPGLSAGVVSCTALGLEAVARAVDEAGLPARRSRRRRQRRRRRRHGQAEARVSDACRHSGCTMRLHFATPRTACLAAASMPRDVCLAASSSCCWQRVLPGGAVHDCTLFELCADISILILALGPDYEGFFL